MIELGYDFDNKNLNKIKKCKIQHWIFIKIY